MEDASDQLVRAGEIIRRLRDFVRQGETEKRMEDLATTIEEAAALALAGPAALGVETRFCFDANAPLVFADRVQIQQVLVNLMRNALEAMTESQDRKLVVATVLRDQETIEITVADSGPGLALGVMDHLFQPFFRPSATAWGWASRFAAPSSRRMAAGFGSSQTRMAGRFSVSLSPLSCGRERTMPGERIVHVVDDDAAFRRSVEVLLEAAGFETCAYESAPAVLDAASQLSDGCMLLDIQMPGMNGLELQTRLNELGIHLPVIVMTGQGDVATAVRAMKAGAVDFIEKPFADDLLLTTIENALAATPERASREGIIGDAAARIAMLSPRERQVLEGILSGRSTKIIAHDLEISPRTVEVHRARMLERLGTRNLSEAIRLTVLAGLGSAVG
jgi:FixJ family two-component response regulator